MSLRRLDLQDQTFELEIKCDCCATPNWSSAQFEAIVQLTTDAVFSFDLLYNQAVPITCLMELQVIKAGESTAVVMDSFITISGNTPVFSCINCFQAGVHSAEFWHGITSRNGGAKFSFSIYACEIRAIPSSEQPADPIDLAAQPIITNLELPDFQQVHPNCRSIFDYFYYPTNTVLINSIDKNTSTDHIKLLFNDLSNSSNGQVWFTYALYPRGINQELLSASFPIVFINSQPCAARSDPY